jgi:probable F420-dependent oxidoreductase
MEIGLSVFLTEQSGPIGEIARAAEQSGFDSLWLPEHMSIPVHYDFKYNRTPDGKIPEFFAHLPDPFVTLAMAAQATERIKLATGICILPQRNAVVTAKAAATLDFYSNGRLIVGVGAGWFPDEAAIMGVEFEKRWQILRETAEAMRCLWTEEEAEYSGEFVNFPPVRLFPKPIQKPHPPIYLGVHDPRHAPRRVVRYADGWCPGDLGADEAKDAIAEVKRLAKVIGRNPGSIEFSVLVTPKDGWPDLRDMRKYQEAGMRRIILRVLASAEGNGVGAIRNLASFVEMGTRVREDGER